MPVAIPLVSMLVAMFLLLLVFTWQSGMHRIFEALARWADVTIATHIPRVGDIHLGALSRAIRHADVWVERQLSGLLTVAIWPVVALLTLARNVVLDPARELAYISRDAAQAIAGLRRYVIPAMIAAKVAWIPRHLVALEAAVQGLLTRAPVHIVHKVVEIATKATTTVVNKAVAVPWPRIRGAERDISGLWKKVKALAHRVPVALTAAALTAIVARTSFRWVRCAKVGRVGRGVCGMNESMLESLLADTVLVVGTISLVEFCHGLQAGMDEVTPQIRHFWRA